MIKITESCPHCSGSIDIYKEYDCEDMPWDEDAEMDKDCPHCNKKIVIYAYASLVHGIKEIEE